MRSFLFCNALTGTNFKNGEFGAIYTECKYEDIVAQNGEEDYSDAGNNKTSEIDARGNETKYEYNATTSKPTAVIDRLENRTEYTYDDAGRTTSVGVKSAIKDGADNVVGYNQEGTVSYGYNSYDDLTSITRGDGQSYTMGYDAYRNLTSVKIEGMTKNLVTYDYKTGGNRLKSMTYANGAVQNLTYDRFGNVIGEAWNGVMAYRYFYDASNQLVKTLDISNKKMYNINRVGENVTSIEEYDVATITVSENIYTPSGLTLVGTKHYSFDFDGKQFRKKYVAADGSEQKYVFEYQDEQNVAVQLPTGVVSHAKSDHLGRKVFDELQLGKGLMNRKFTYHEGVITETHKAKDKEVSDPQTTLVKQIEFADGRTIQYEYDREERITQVIDTIDGVETKTVYTYDALGQLLTETVNGVEVNRMTYDQYGNIATKNDKTYTYDTVWKDKLLSTENGLIGNYDDNGNPQSYLGNTLTWEKGRQLKQYGANTYKYNNEGIRIQKTTSSEIHEYILDGTNIVKEIVSDICNCSKYVNEYLYDLDGTVCGLKHNGTAYYFYKNLQGDVIAITDDSGAIVARYTYDAWGKCTIVSNNSGVGIAIINPFRYRSYYYDTETELYYLQSRYYNPEVGRFINADAVINRHRVVSDNLFVYCENDPIAYTDESGYSPSYYNAFFKALVLTNKEFKKESDYIAKSFGMFVTSKVSTFTGSSSFRKLWNKTACDYDVVVVNCHSSYNRMQYLISPNYRFKKIHAKALVLLGCNAGHYNYIWSNVAKKFSKYVSGYVMASDGTVYSSSKNPSFNPVFTSKPDKSWERYNRRNKRTTNYGWVIYQYLRGTYYWWSTNLVSASVNDMLSYLCNVGFLIFDQYYAPDIYRL